MAMLSRTKVMAALTEKRPQFEQYQSEQRSQSDLRRQLLDRFMAMSAADVLRRVEQSGQEWPGALPTTELDQAMELCIPCARRWSNHQEARQWALSVLEGRPTAAVDGSQWRLACAHRYCHRIGFSPMPTRRMIARDHRQKDLSSRFIHLGVNFRV